MYRAVRLRLPFVRKGFYTQIIADLKEAVAKLPVSTSDYGRATKGAAEAFLARVYLYNKIMRKR